VQEVVSKVLFNGKKDVCIYYREDYRMMKIFRGTNGAFSPPNRKVSTCSSSGNRGPTENKVRFL